MAKDFDPDKYRKSIVDAHNSALKALATAQEKIDGKDGKPGKQAAVDKAQAALAAAQADVRTAEKRVAQTRGFLAAHDNVAGAPVVTEGEAVAEHEAPAIPGNITEPVILTRPVADNPQA